MSPCCRRVFRRLACGGATVVACTGAAAVAGAQDASCVTDTLTAGFPTAWIGQRVGQITVDAMTVEAPRGLMGNFVRSLHSRTRLQIPMSDISIAPGSVVDSLDVLESVRRLRRTGLYSDVMLTGTRCGDDRLDLMVHTRDAWSLRAGARYGRVSSRVAVSEVNLFGRAVTASILAENLYRRDALSVGLADSHLIGSRVRGSVLMRTYADGRAWSWSVRSTNYSPRDVWRFSVLSDQLRRFRDDVTTGELEDINRRTDAVTVTRRITADDHRVYAFILGAEHELADLVVQQLRGRPGTTAVSREFTAPLVGLARRSLDMGSIDWLVPGQLPAELPLGLEGELVTGVGHDVPSKSTIVHVDGWVGVTLKPTKHSVVTGDVWASGYYLPDSLFNGALRGSLSLYGRGRRGIWAMRVAGERLANPDPDVVALSSIDPMLHSLSPSTRLAESALMVSLERSVTLLSREGRWAVDAVPFVQYSQRNGSVNMALPSPTNPRALLVGIGWRRVRSQPTQAPLRFDIAKTVWEGGGLPNRWVFVLSTQPWVALGRNRDGMRESVR